MINRAPHQVSRAAPPQAVSPPPAPQLPAAVASTGWTWQSLALETWREGGRLLVQCQASPVALVAPGLRTPAYLARMYAAGLPLQQAPRIPLLFAVGRLLDARRVRRADPGLMCLLAWGVWAAMQTSELRREPQGYAFGCLAAATAHLGCHMFAVRPAWHEIIFACSYTAAREAGRWVWPPWRPQ